MWLIVLKVILVGVLTLGVAVLVVAGVRRSRANRGDPRWTRRASGQPGYEASVRGTMPETPLPDWVDGNDDNIEPGGTGRS
jgi:hypothetical protein